MLQRVQYLIDFVLQWHCRRKFLKLVFFTAMHPDVNPLHILTFYCHWTSSESLVDVSDKFPRLSRQSLWVPFAESSQCYRTSSSLTWLLVQFLMPSSEMACRSFCVPRFDICV